VANCFNERDFDLEALVETANIFRRYQKHFIVILNKSDELTTQQKQNRFNERKDYSCNEFKKVYTMFLLLLQQFLMHCAPMNQKTAPKEKNTLFYLNQINIDIAKPVKLYNM